jgi:hypothetical protein
MVVVEATAAAGTEVAVVDITAAAEEADTGAVAGAGREVLVGAGVDPALLAAAVQVEMLRTPAVRVLRPDITHRWEAWEEARIAQASAEIISYRTITQRQVRWPVGAEAWPTSTSRVTGALEPVG